MLQQIGLVRMNGRVYDPQVAHFMSADILVSHPFGSQSWNGYSYVSNDPLNRVDPSGWQEYALPPVTVISTPTVVGGGGATHSGAGGVAMCSGRCGSGNTGSGYSYGSGDAWNPMDDFSSHIGWGQSAMDYHNRTVSQLMGGGAWAGFRIAIPTLPVVLPHQSLFSPPPVLTPLADAAGLIAGTAWDDIGTTSGATTLATATSAYQYASGHMMEPGLEAPLIDPIDLLTGGILAKGVFKAASLFAFRKVETLAAGEAVATIDTSLVRFTQSTVGQTFRTGENINEVAAALGGSGGDALAAAFNPIRIFEQDGLLFTLDNRRLLTFSIAGREVPYVWATEAERAAEAWKFTATPEQMGGWFIGVRP